MTISDKAWEVSRNNVNVHARLMMAFNKSSRAIQYWFKHKSLMLTTAAAMAIIKEETGLKEEEILAEEPVKA